MHDSYLQDSELRVLGLKEIGIDVKNIGRAHV